MHLIRHTRWFAVVVAATFMIPSLATATPITDGLALWLDAADTSTLFQDAALTIPAGVGDPIGGWADKSGNDFDAFMDVDSARPVYTADTMNGQPSVRLTAADQSGLIIDPDLQVTRPYTAFVVNQYWGSARGRTLQSAGGQDAAHNWLTGLWAGRFAHYAEGWVSNPATGGAITNKVYVTDATGDPGGSTFNVNGFDFTNDAVPTGEPFAIAIGGVGQFPEHSDADVSEVIIYDRVLDESELNDVRTYLYDKYNPDLIDFTEPNHVNFGTLGTFTGGDAGDGLDLDGNFQYAVNAAGPGGFSVRDANFTAQDAAGVTIKAVNTANPWGDPADFGDTADDNNIETVMNSIRWSNGDGRDQSTVDIDLTGLVPGAEYKLQLLIAERGSDRGFNIIIDGETAVDRFHAPSLVGTPEAPEVNDLTEAAVYTYEFVAENQTLSISLDGRETFFSDPNALIHGFTLEVSLDNIGDFNFDGTIDSADFDIMLEGMFNGDNYVEGDFNLDGTVDFQDFRGFKSAFQAAGAASVPEPSTGLLLVLGVGLSWLVSRRTRR